MFTDEDGDLDCENSAHRNARTASKVVELVAIKTQMSAIGSAHCMLVRGASTMPSRPLPADVRPADVRFLALNTPNHGRARFRSIHTRHNSRCAEKARVEEAVEYSRLVQEHAKAEGRKELGK